MRLYIASFFDTRQRLYPVMRTLEEQGHRVIARWLVEPIGVQYATVTNGYRLACAIADLSDIRNAELFILDTLDETPRGGREVEFGFALALGVPVVVVGQPRNVFHQLSLHRFDTWDACLEFLAGVNNNRG